MIIICPHCGPREISEYTYVGDATLVGPIIMMLTLKNGLIMFQIPVEVILNTGSILQDAGHFSESAEYGHS